MSERDKELRDHLQAILSLSMRAAYRPSAPRAIRQHAERALQLLSEQPHQVVAGELEGYLEKLRLEAEQLLVAIDIQSRRLEEPSEAPADQTSPRPPRPT